MRGSPAGDTFPVLDLAGAILVVEDDADCRNVLGELLELAGHSVVACGDVGAALLRARASTPSLVLVDLHLPGRDGTSLVEALAAEGPPLADVPVVLTTGSADARAVAKKLGVRVLEKPLDADRLLDLIGSLVQRPRAARP